MADAGYPITYRAEWIEPRSRLTTFFRLFLAIPPLFMTVVFSLALVVTVPIAWFALLFTARYPEGLYHFHARTLRLAAVTAAYLNLAVDPFPDLLGRPDPGYPAQVTIGPPQERYNRWLVAFRAVFFLPVYVVIYYAMSTCVLIGALCSWFVILFTGKAPKGLQDILDLGLNAETRARAYLMLMTDRWPPFADSSSGFAPQPNRPAPVAAPTSILSVNGVKSVRLSCAAKVESEAET